MTVAYPQMMESIKSTLNEIIAPYFAEQQVINIGGQDVQFYAANLEFDSGRIQTDINSGPVIVFQPISDGFTDKKVNISQPNDFGFERWERIMCVTTIAALPDQNQPNASKLMIDRLWGCLQAVFNTQFQAFTAAGIRFIKCPATANEQQHPDYLVIGSRINFTAVAKFSRG